MTYQLGIDLGTTYTAAAVCRSSDRRWVEPEVVTLGSRSATVPSVLFVASDGSVVVGEAAERRAVTDFDRVVREFKRRIGDPTPVMVAGRPWAPQELSARLVRWVVDRVAEREGGPADRIAVTHPAAWGQHKKDLLTAALAGQGLTVTFLAEPQAAALSYAANERIGGGSTIVVYDLGGGTFDAAVVRKGDPNGPGGPAGFGLVGRPQGLERLGGIDFDEAVFQHVLEGMPDAFVDLDETDPAVLSAIARLRRDCTEAKEALSSDTEVSIPVMLPSARGSVRLHRSEFEAMIRPHVEETVGALRSTVISAGFNPEQLTAVLLVGGSSRIPLVGQLVSEQLGRPVAVDADPKNAIAKGAALAVSPKPTVSWPGVSIPPVPAAAGAAAAGMGGPPAAPPMRPPMPGSGMAPPPSGGGRHGGGSPYDGPGSPYADQRGAPAYAEAPAPQYAEPQYAERQYAEPQYAEPQYAERQYAEPQYAERQYAEPGPSGPGYGGPDASRHGTDQGYPPAGGRHGREPEPDYAPVPARANRLAEPEPDWDDEPEPPRRRNTGLLVGVGVLVLAAIVVAGALLWSNAGGTGTAANESGSPTSDSAPARSGSSSRGGGSSGGSSSGEEAPPAQTTTPAPTSVADEPPADEKPSASAKPTKGSDSSDDSGSDSSSDPDSGSADSGGDSGDTGGAGGSEDGGSSDNG